MIMNADANANDAVPVRTGRNQNAFLSQTRPLFDPGSGWGNVQPLELLAFHGVVGGTQNGP